MSTALSRKYYLLSLLLILLHIVGAVGCMLDFSRSWMLMLTPVNLLISASILIYNHEASKKKLFLFLALSGAIGFIVELMGVKTGMIFGSYEYGNTLGMKLWDVPIIIGINWFILSYAFGCITKHLRIHFVLKSIIAASMMTLLDFLIEPVAIYLDYWSWENNEIPIQNYLGWFITALLIQLLFHKFDFNAKNQVSKILIISQLIFFTSLFIYLL
ncbi:MAG: carotenoid biosynthesis protein [Cyclobacteriaceae bacterium]